MSSRGKAWRWWPRPRSRQTMLLKCWDVSSKNTEHRSIYGAPQYLRSDNGPEFVSKAVREWLQERGVQTAYIEPGCPWQNGFAESFHSRFRDECLNREWFHNVREARVLAESYRRYYNQERPHSSLNYMTPLEFHAAWLQGR